MLDAGTPYKVNTATVTNFPGAYYNGATVQQKDFSLYCYFEDLTDAQLDKIYQWVHVGVLGELVFDERPWITYMVRPSKLPTGDRYQEHTNRNLLTVYSGTITLDLTAYYPFGTMNTLELADNEVDEYRIESFCGILRHSMIPAVSTAMGTKLVWNPGTEPTPATITVRGTIPSGRKLVIVNSANNDTCEIVGLPSGQDLVIDSKYQKITVGSNYAFAYHDKGYINLEPCFPYRRDIYVITAQGSASLKTTAKFYQEDVGSYIYVQGAWRKILAVAEDGGTCTVNSTLATTQGDVCLIGKMNELIVSTQNITGQSGSGNASLSKLTITFDGLMR